MINHPATSMEREAGRVFGASATETPTTSREREAGRVFGASATETPTTSREREAGQVLPMTAIFLTVFAIVAYFLLGPMGTVSVVESASETALRGGGLAALIEGRANIDGYGRWYVDPTDGDATVRAIVRGTLLGLPDSASYATLVGADTDLAIGRGTASGTQTGLDVEILNPAAQAGQTSEAYFNGFPETVVACESRYPEPIGSALVPGSCYDTATIIMRLRIIARIPFGTQTLIDKIVVMRAGTDV
jgi:hypothetical protein